MGPCYWKMSCSFLNLHTTLSWSVAYWSLKIYHLAFKVLVVSYKISSYQWWLARLVANGLYVLNKDADTTRVADGIKTNAISVGHQRISHLSLKCLSFFYLQPYVCLIIPYIIHQNDNNLRLTLICRVIL